eukprot:1937479-Prymnesium_polylepis.1
MRCLDRNARGAERSTLTCLPLRNDVSFERGWMCSIGSHVSPRAPALPWYSVADVVRYSFDPPLREPYIKRTDH